MGTRDITLLLGEDPTMGLTATAAALRRALLVEGGYSLNSGEAGAGVGACEAVVGCATLDGEGIGLGPRPVAHGGWTVPPPA